MSAQLRPRSAIALLILPVLAGTRVAAHAQDSVTRICLAPASVEATSGNATAAIDAARESFTAYLTGPSLQAEPLKSRLTSQVKEEAKLANCPYLLLTTIKVVQKSSGGGVLGRMAATAAQQGAVEAGLASGSTAGRVAGSVGYAAAGQAAYTYAVTIRKKDEITLGYQLEKADGTMLVDKREKRSAKSDGEDVLTPLVQTAAEQIVAAAKAVSP